ncbi:MAG: FecR domain-containing protein [Pseudomonadota bacterium]
MSKCRLATNKVTAIGSIVLAAMLTFPAFAAAEVIGHIKTTKGDVVVVSHGLKRAVQPGDKLRVSDTVQTGDNSSVGITFRDDSRTALGPNSKMQMKEFAFEPAENQYSFVSKMFKGSMVFVSGLIAKLAPDTARVETTTATVGIRGTRFLLRVEEE